MGFSGRDVAIRGTVMALIIAVPSLGAFFISWYATGDIVISAIIGALVHFVAMGFSIKISRRLAK